MKLIGHVVGVTLMLLVSNAALAGVIKADSAGSQQLYHTKLVYNGKNLEDGYDSGELVYSHRQTIAGTPATINLALTDLTAYELSLVQLPVWDSSLDVTLMSWRYRQIDAAANSLQQAAAVVICNILSQSSYNCPSWTMQPWYGLMGRQSAASFFGGGPYYQTQLRLETQGSSQWYDETSNELQTFTWRQQLYFETASIPDWGIQLRTPSMAELFAWLPTAKSEYFYQTDANRYQCDNANTPWHQCTRLGSEHIYLTNTGLAIQLSAVATPAPVGILVVVITGLLCWRRRIA